MEIYKITNVVTDMVYIGATTSSADIRLADHLSKASSDGTKLQVAMSEYPKESFQLVVIDTATNQDELAQKEIDYIEQYNSFRSGYNSNRGGGMQKTVYQFELDGTEPIASYQSLAEASEAVNASPKSISNACIGYNQSCNGYRWSYESIYFTIQKVTNKKVVLQYDLEDNLINTFESAREASRILGIGLSSITRCCRGERRQASGFVFNYQ